MAISPGKPAVPPIQPKPATGPMATPAPVATAAEPAKPAEPVTPVKNQNRRGYQARPSRFHAGEYKIQHWYHVTEAGAELDDVLQPYYFAHVAQQIQPFSKITVVAEDGHFYAELLVVDARYQTVITTTLISRELAPVSRDGFKTDLHQIRYLGAELKFTVVRNADNAAIKSGFTDEMQAYQFLNDLEKTIRLNKLK